MVIRVNIELAQDQTISNTPSQLAAEILAACEGTPENDYCSVTVMASPIPGSVGTLPGPPAPITQEQAAPPPAEE